MTSWLCAVCSKCVKADKHGNPESTYWNVEYNQTYCSDKCSLEAHQKGYKDD